MICLMDHIVLNVTNLEQMISFYTEIIQLTSERMDEFREGRVSFPSVRLNSNTIIDLFPPEMWQDSSDSENDKSRLNHFCFSLTEDDWRELMERLNSNGVVINEGPTQRWGARGKGNSIYFSDPDGNKLEARYYE